MHTKLLLTASIALALAGNCFAAVKDGSYTTTVTGHNAPLTVTVDIKNGKISGPVDSFQYNHMVGINFPNRTDQSTV